jgi:hypothetical protein
MSLFAWTQNVPIDASAYRDIAARMGTAPLPGLLVHVAIEQPDGGISYLDVWDSEESCNASMASVVHPAVGPVLAARGIRPAGEPPRTPIKVIDVRFADGSSIPG